MKIFIVLNLLLLSCFGEYEKMKIETHGGKNYDSYNSKSSFRSTSFGLSNFLDKNASKQADTRKGKHNEN